MNILSLSFNKLATSCSNVKPAVAASYGKCKNLKNVKFPTYSRVTSSLNKLNKTAIRLYTAGKITHTVRSLLDKQDYEGNTALHVSIKTYGDSSIEICDLLISRGADPTIPDNTGMTPLDTAKARNYQEIITLLAETDKKKL